MPGVGMCPQSRELALELLRQIDVVGVQEGDVLAASRSIPGCGTRSCRDAPVRVLQHLIRVGCVVAI
jgi:hypothetical protein